MTEAEIREQLSGWHDALKRVQSGQSYVIGGVRNGRTLNRADLPEIRNTIDWLEGKLTKVTQGSGIRMRRAIP